MYVIHQPYFAPWLGYFAKFKYATNFCVLNNVLFSKRHNIDKTLVIGMNSEPLSIHIPCGENLGKKINEIFIDNDSFIERILKSIEYSYKTSKLFNEEWHFIKYIFQHCMDESNRLDLIDLFIIKNVCNYLDLEINYRLSDDILTQDRTERIIMASDKLQDKDLLLGDGKSLDVHNIDKLKNNNINIYQLRYFEHHPVYFQCRRQKAPFLKCMSIVDALLNVGKIEVKKLISSVEPIKIL